MQRVGLNGSIKKQRSWIFCAILCGLVLLDQLTKLYFHANFKEGESVVVIPDFFSFALFFNEGAAWSFLSDKTWGQLFFKILTPVFLILLLVFLVSYLKNI